MGLGAGRDAVLERFLVPYSLFSFRGRQSYGGDYGVIPMLMPGGKGIAADVLAPLVAARNTLRP